MKKSIIITVCLAFILAIPVHAQTTDLPEAGSTPASPLYFAERFFEGIGTFFTFGSEAKTERYIELAEERLAEAQVLAEEGDERAEKAVARYEEQIEKAKESSAKSDSAEDLEVRITDATTGHLTALDRVLERVPEQARDSIQSAKERSMRGQIESLRGIIEHNPDSAVEIFDRAAEGRLMAAERRANRVNSERPEDVENALEEFEEYASFGDEISTIAEGLQSGDTTVEELVERTTTRHREMLERVRERVPEEARESIQRVLDRPDRPASRPMDRGTGVDRSQSSQPQSSQPQSSQQRDVPDTPQDNRTEEVMPAEAQNRSSSRSNEDERADNMSNDNDENDTSTPSDAVRGRH